MPATSISGLFSNKTSMKCLLFRAEYFTRCPYLPFVNRTNKRKKKCNSTHTFTFSFGLVFASLPPHSNTYQIQRFAFSHTGFGVLRSFNPERSLHAHIMETSEGKGLMSNWHFRAQKGSGQQELAFTKFWQLKKEPLVSAILGMD